MRWMSIILVATLLAAPLWAGSGTGTKFGYDSAKLQLAQALSQSPEQPAPQPAAAAAPAKLVPGKAFLLSAIIPGTGQLYAKSYIWAGVFMALEVGTWTEMAVYHSKGMNKDSEFKKYAEDHWTFYDETVVFPAIPTSGNGSYLSYEYWAAHTFGNNGSVFNGSISEWMTKTWTYKQDYLPSAGFTHEIDGNNHDQQYYEMIGKYNQFWAGWDLDGNTIAAPSGTPIYGHWLTGWSVQNVYREAYLNMRKESNDALDISKDFSMAIMANHLLAAIHAGFSVSMHNRKLAKAQKIEGAFQIEPRRYQDEMVSMATLKVRF
jgi:hypothetical protein